MPIDDRLRRELWRDADRIDADVEGHLLAVQARVRRPALPISSLLAAAVTLVVVAGVVRMSAPSGPGSTPLPSGPTAAIAGSYVTDLPSSDPRVAEHRLAGRWELQVGPDGVAVLIPPAGFQAGAASFPGIAMSLTGDQVRTDALYNDYCSSVGTYRWTRSGDQVTLEPVDDTCVVRQALLSTEPWTAAP